MRLIPLLSILLLLSGCSGASRDLRAVLKDGTITALCPWRTGGKSLAAAARMKEVKEEGKTFHIRYIEVFDVTDGRADSLLSTGEVGEVVNLFTTGETDEPLVAVTKQEKGYRIYAFASLNGKVEQVLDAGSQRMPEVLRSNDTDDSVLLITDTQRRPWQTFRWRWTGEKFKLEKTVLYPQRFR